MLSIFKCFSFFLLSISIYSQSIIGSKNDAGKMQLYLDHSNNARYARDTLIHHKTYEKAFFQQASSKSYTPSELIGVHRIKVIQDINRVRVEHYNLDGDKVSYNDVIKTDKEFIITDHHLSLYRIRHFNLNGNILKEEIRDLQGNPAQGGIAFINYRYDHNENLIYQDHKNYAGNLAEDSEGNAIYIYKYTPKGSLLYEKRYDKNKKLRLLGDGYSFIKNYYNSQEQLVTEEYYDKNGKVISDSEKFAKVVYEYTEDGLLESYHYTNKSDEPVNNSFNINKYSFSYNANEQIIQKKFYNLDGIPVPDEFGVFSYSYKYDDEDRILFEKKYKSPKDNDINLTEVYAYKYDDNGNKVSEQFFVNNDKEPIYKTMYCTFQYINKDYIIVLPDDNPSDCVLIKNSSGAKYKYNSQNQLTAARYYSSEKIILDLQYNYNEKGQLIEVLYKDPDKLVPIYGIHPLKIEYDSSGNIIAVSQQTEAKKIRTYKAQTWYQYNEKNLLESKIYLNQENSIINQGIAQIEYQYDDQNQLKQIRYFNSSGYPEKSSSKSHRIVKEYNSLGKISLVEKYSRKNKLLSKKIFQYSKDGKITKEEEYLNGSALRKATYHLYMYINSEPAGYFHILYNRMYDIIDSEYVRIEN